MFVIIHFKPVNPPLPKDIVTLTFRPERTKAKLPLNKPRVKLE